MSEDVGRTGQFRFAYFTADYDSTVAFYRDRLGFPVVASWDRGPEDRGSVIGAASGLIEVLQRPADDDAEHLFDPRPPQGAFMVIEVEDVDRMYRQVVERGVPIYKELSTQTWGHRSFCVREPNGLVLYVFSE